MVYQYSCPKCAHVFDVIKSVREFDKEESCEKCQATAVRDFAPKRLHLVHTKVQEAEYNPGLGCVVKDRQHRAEICKQKGLEEIGNEKPDKIHQHFEKRREEKWENGWEEATKGWIGNGE